LQWKYNKKGRDDSDDLEFEQSWLVGPKTGTGHFPSLFSALPTVSTAETKLAVAHLFAQEDKCTAVRV
jgi:hypothetical protein